MSDSAAAVSCVGAMPGAGTTGGGGSITGGGMRAAERGRVGRPWAAGARSQAVQLAVQLAASRLGAAQLGEALWQALATAPQRALA
jgi:hypothetical protein